MRNRDSKRPMTRRQLLRNSVAVGAIAVVGAGFIAAPDAAWALEEKVISSHQMATLLQMARDIYPHDRVADRYYAIAVKGYDSAAQKDLVGAGVARLDTLARAAGASSYVALPWEEARVAVLKQIERDSFFQTVRGGLLSGLYNQPAIWPIFGYEGESFSQGGYLTRGFNDINWL